MSKFYSSFNKTNICNVIVAIWFFRNRKQIKVDDACIFVKTNKKKLKFLQCNVKTNTLLNSRNKYKGKKFT